MRTHHVVGVGLILVGGLVLWLAQLGHVTLEGTPAGVTCSYRRSVLGLVTTRTGEVRGVTHAELEVVESHRDPAATQYDLEQVVLVTPNGEVRPPWLEWRRSIKKEGTVYRYQADFPGLAGRVNAVAKAGRGRITCHDWSGTLLSVGGGLMLFGLFLLWPAPRNRGPEPSRPD